MSYKACQNRQIEYKDADRVNVVNMAGKDRLFVATWFQRNIAAVSALINDLYLITSSIKYG